MSIKKKIKRMLAFMLKDELIELVEQSYPLKPFEFVERTIEFNTVKAEYEFSFHEFAYDPAAYERQIEIAKEHLFEQIQNCIEIQHSPLLNNADSYKRRFRLLLRVQKPQY